MLVINTTYNDLVKALESVNSYYEDNIKFVKLTPKDSSDIAMATRFTFTLRVNDCRGAGSMETGWRGRRSQMACWHAHGDFFDSLNEDAKIKVGALGVDGWIRPGDKWNRVYKYQAGFQIDIADLCEC